jgi:hypothetical protein
MRMEFTADSIIMDPAYPFSSSSFLAIKRHPLQA